MIKGKTNVPFAAASKSKTMLAWALKAQEVSLCLLMS
jgi:hypothetical protein